MSNENGKVSLKNKSGAILELEFSHAFRLLKMLTKEGRNYYKVVGNHEFKNNELIIKPSTKGRKKSTKSDGSQEG